MNFTFKITDFQPQIEYGETVAIELFTNKEYDDDIHQTVAVDKIVSIGIIKMHSTILQSAPKFLVRWSESAAYSHWKSPQSPLADDSHDTRNFGFEPDRAKPLSVLVNR